MNPSKDNSQELRESRMNSENPQYIHYNIFNNRSGSAND